MLILAVEYQVEDTVPSQKDLILNTFSAEDEGILHKN